MTVFVIVVVRKTLLVFACLCALFFIQGCADGSGDKQSASTSQAMQLADYEDVEFSYRETDTTLKVRRLRRPVWMSEYANDANLLPPEYGAADPIILNAMRGQLDLAKVPDMFVDQDDARNFIKMVMKHSKVNGDVQKYTAILQDMGEHMIYLGDIQLAENKKIIVVKRRVGQPEVGEPIKGGALVVRGDDLKWRMHRKYLEESQLLRELESSDYPMMEE